MTNEVQNAVNVIKEYLALDKDIEGNEYLDSLKVMVQALESQRWIFVSSGQLPKPNEIVLVTIKRWGHHDNDLFEDLPEYTYSTSFTCYNPHFGFNNDVVAWMPLPEPYKPESEE